MVLHHNRLTVGIDKSRFSFHALLPLPLKEPASLMLANYTPLTPLSLLRRTADVFPERVAVRYGDRTFNYREFQERCRRLASALSLLGIQRGDVVSIISPNTPAMLEAHFGVAMMGGVLHAINMRLDASAIAYMLDHAQSKALLADDEFAAVAIAALEISERTLVTIGIADPAVERTEFGVVEYESLLASGDPDYVPVAPCDEGQPIALNYTSGTTGKPKGVVYDHRGAYLNAIANTLAWEMGRFPVYLWTLPMFHCNGWCFPWTVTALAGTHVCLRRPEPDRVTHAIFTEGVSHLCGAPVILAGLVEHNRGQALPHRVNVMTAGAPPPAAIIETAESLGFDITQTYGLTEVYGPCVVCEWKPEWNDFEPDVRAKLKARQGVRYAMQEDVAVLDPGTMTPVLSDGQSMGEIMIRGNIVMREYFEDPEGTAAAFAGGWFHTGDLAVCHEDGYLEIRDRSKDIIITGGENVSSVEVESAIHRHPAVADAAVVARPDSKWGETPIAFVSLAAGQQLSEQALIEHCRKFLAGFKLPKSVVFGPLPRTSTGKVQKYILRERAREIATKSAV